MLVCRTTAITDLKMHFTGKKCENLIFMSFVFGGLNFLWHLVMLLLWPIHSAWLNFHYDFNAGVTIMFQNGYATTVSVMRALTLMLLAEPPGFESYFFTGVNNSVFLVTMSACCFIDDSPCSVHASCSCVMFLSCPCIMFLGCIPVSCPCHVSVSYSCVIPLSCFCDVFLCHDTVMFLGRIPVSYPCHVSVSYSCVMPLSCCCTGLVNFSRRLVCVLFCHYSIHSL